MTIDTEWFTNLGPTAWIILGGLVLLWGSKLVPSDIIAKLKALVTRDTPPQPADELPALILQLRLAVCDDPPRIRDGVNRHLDEIEQLLAGTEISSE